MNFNTDKPIYLQIVDVICDRILSGELKGGDRIPSVREYGADIGVNPNTMMRSYEKLTADGIIFNKRGIGYFVADENPEAFEAYEATFPAKVKLRLPGQLV